MPEPLSMQNPKVLIEQCQKAIENESFLFGSIYVDAKGIHHSIGSVVFRNGILYFVSPQYKVSE